MVSIIDGGCCSRTFLTGLGSGPLSRLTKFWLSSSPSSMSSSSSNSNGRLPKRPLALPTCRLLRPLKGFFLGERFWMRSLRFWVASRSSSGPEPVASSSGGVLWRDGASNETAGRSFWAEPTTNSVVASTSDDRRLKISVILGDAGPAPANAVCRRRPWGVRTTDGPVAPVDGFCVKSDFENDAALALGGDLGVVDFSAEATFLLGDLERLPMKRTGDDLWGVVASVGVLLGFAMGSTSFFGDVEAALEDWFASASLPRAGVR